MKKIMMLSLLISLGAVAGGTPGNVTGAVQSVELANVVTPAATLSAQCVTPTAGCSAASGLTVKVGGRASVSVQFATSNFTGTVAPYCSIDGGVSFFNIHLRGSTSPGATSPNTAISASTATLQWPILMPYGGCTDVMFAITTAPTNTLTAQLIASNTAHSILDLAMTSKGTLPSTVLLGVQPAIDSGRSFVALGADGVTPAIAETVITFGKNIGGTLTATQTSYTITSGKTLRIQSICSSFTAGAAANRVRVALRLNTGGACVAGSSILLPVVELAPNYGTATAAEGGASSCTPIPDGLEIAGDGTKAICLSESATAASGTLTTNLIGFEY